MEEQSPSSSSLTYGWTYDVFLNFRGEDTRFDFTINLYKALHQKGIHTFIDKDGLKRGEGITPSLVKAIQESTIAITIFSKNYASSTFCLDELVHILDCIRNKGQLVLPIFYDVDPSDVRHQRGNYGMAFTQHEERFKKGTKKVQKWKQALQDAADIAGFHFKPGQEHECDLIERIVKEVSRRINRKPLHIADYPVGLEYRVRKVNSLLDVESNEEVQMVGICGMGGIGKTTIARAVCNLIADSFEAFCFVADVSKNSQKHGLVYLQKMLLSKLVGEDFNFIDINQGIPIMKQRLHRKKVLLVLDDVDEPKQLKAIAGALDWFGSGSRIIVTTRDKHVLARHGVEIIYEVESLNKNEALRLLKWNAFRENRVDPSFMEILNKVVLYADGLPLALEVIGSNLLNKGIKDWNSALNNYRQIPDREIQQVLKLSYASLDQFEKEIFLDIACCFKGDSLEYVTSALSARGIWPDYATKVLIDKCLIKIDHGLVTMHDLIQDMGKEIIRQQSPNVLGRRSRLWFHEDILQVLEGDKGTEEIEAIYLHMPGDKVINWSGLAFKKMPNLKILIVRNARFSTGPKHLPNRLRFLDWKGYPYPSLPYDFCPKELFILRMPGSDLKLDSPLKASTISQFFNKLILLLQRFQSVSVMDFSGCKFLTELPDISGVSNLKELCLDFCENLIKVHDCIGFLHKLERLSITHCFNLKTFPSISLTSLEFFDLSWCSNLQRFPEMLTTMGNIRDVRLDHSGIEELPLSFKNLIGLQYLDLSNCEHLREFRAIPPNLQELEVEDKHLSSESCRILLSQAISACQRKRPLVLVTLFLDTNFVSDNVLQQALGEVDGLRFVMLEDKMPGLFDHYTEGHSICFWFRNIFPNMAVCFGGESDIGHHGELILNGSVYVNGELLESFVEERIYGRITSEHTFLVDLQNLIHEDKVNRVALEHQWNKIQIWCTLRHRRNQTWAKAKGIYVYKQKSRMDDIRFIDPNEEISP
ncbi:hypothetical protein K1719_013533 [Acacia pycnantha]|nr:hypothetical protein K1719_013533 [Acacia pycnantha]